MLFPYRSAFDPEAQGEGSIDRLGLARVADGVSVLIPREMLVRLSRRLSITTVL